MKYLELVVLESLNYLQFEFSTFPMPDHEALIGIGAPGPFFAFHMAFQNSIELVIPSEARVWRVFGPEGPQTRQTIFDDWIHEWRIEIPVGQPKKKSKNHRKTLNRVGPAARPCSPAALRDISRDHLHSAQCTHWRPYSLSSFKFAPPPHVPDFRFETQLSEVKSSLP